MKTVVCAVVGAAMVLSVNTSWAEDSSVVAMQITGGELAGQRLDGNNPRIVVEPSAGIGGRVHLSVRNDMGANAIAPLAATPTWGEPEQAVWEIEHWVKTGTTEHKAGVNLTAPQTPGKYYIVFALAGTYNVAQIMSGTHPGWDADWARGNNVARQPPHVFRKAMEQGWVPFSWYSPEGPKNGTMAMTAVEVVVKGAQTTESKQGSRRVFALRCLSCGKLNELDSKFCQGCGGRL
jgi:hypothetical protein